MQLSSFTSDNSILLDIPLEHLNNQNSDSWKKPNHFLSQLACYLGIFLYLAVDKYKWGAAKNSTDT